MFSPALRPRSREEFTRARFLHVQRNTHRATRGRFANRARSAGRAQNACRTVPRAAQRGCTHFLAEHTKTCWWGVVNRFRQGGGHPRFRQDYSTTNALNFACLYWGHCPKEDD